MVEGLELLFENSLEGFRENLPSAGKISSICFAGENKNMRFHIPGKKEAAEFANKAKKLSFQELTFCHIGIPLSLLDAIEPIDAAYISFNGVSVIGEAKEKLSEFMRTRKNAKTLVISNIKSTSNFILKLFHQQAGLSRVKIQSIRGIKLASLSRKLYCHNLSTLKLTGIILNSMEDQLFLLKLLGSNNFNLLIVEVSKMASRFSNLYTLFSRPNNHVKVGLLVRNPNDLNRFLLKPTFKSKDGRSRLCFDISLNPAAVKSFASTLENLGTLDEIVVKKRRLSLHPLATLVSRLNQAMLGNWNKLRFSY